MDDVLKQRLIGAAVLIALAVIFVPMLFDRSQDPTLEGTLNSDIPESPLADREVRRIPLNPTASRQGTWDDERTSVEVPTEVVPTTEPRVEPTRERLSLTGSAGQESVEPSAQQAPAQTPESDTAPEADAVLSMAPEPSPIMGDELGAPTPAPRDEMVTEASITDWATGWRVQVASFGAEATAEEIAAAVRALDQGVRIDRVVRGQSVLYRIQTGPYATRQAAEQAMAMITESIEGVSLSLIHI